MLINVTSCYQNLDPPKKIPYGSLQLSRLQTCKESQTNLVLDISEGFICSTEMNRPTVSLLFLCLFFPLVALAHCKAPGQIHVLKA